MDRRLVFEDFSDKVGQIFSITFDDAPAIAMTLAEAELMPSSLKGADVRPAFSLVFLIDVPKMLPQQLYRVEQEALGQMDLFLVPVGKKPDGFEYQAMFN